MATCMTLTHEELLLILHTGPRERDVQPAHTTPQGRHHISVSGTEDGWIIHASSAQEAAINNSLHGDLPLLQD